MDFVELIISKNDIDKIKDILKEFFEICNSSPNFLKKVFPRIVNILSKLRDLNTEDEGDLKVEALDCLVNFVICYPDLVAQDESLKVLINLIFKNMVELDEEISQEWMSPPDGFNDDLYQTDDQKVIKAAMSNIDTLLADLDCERVIKIVLTYIQ